MDSRGRPIYREDSPWPGWILVVFWGTMLVTIGAVAVAPGESHEEQIWGAFLVAGVAVIVQWLLAGLTVRLFRDFLLVGLGSSLLVSRQVRYDDISALESVQYHPIRDFGGWGVRGSDKRRIWSSRGDEAVVLHLADGRQLYIGSDRPQRLEERIRAVGGTRIGPKQPAR